MKLVNGRLVDDNNEPVDTPTLDEAAPTASSNTSDEYPTCETCGQVNYEWQPGQRGRKPKYHRDCRPIAPSRNASSGARGSFRNEAALREALTNRYYMLGSLMAMIHPAYMASVRDNTERAVEADLSYARVNPKFRKHIESFCEKTAAGEVIAVHAAMFAPVVLGEASKRARAKAAKQGRPMPPPSRHDPTRPQQGARPEPKPEPKTEPTPDNVTHIRGTANDMPDTGETVAETVNAGAMPGMPG